MAWAQHPKGLKGTTLKVLSTFPLLQGALLLLNTAALLTLSLFKMFNVSLVVTFGVNFDFLV